MFLRKPGDNFQPVLEVKAGEATVPDSNSTFSGMKPLETLTRHQNDLSCVLYHDQVFFVPEPNWTMSTETQQRTEHEVSSRQHLIS